MEVKKIFFDLDGVLADFSRGAVEIAGCEPLLQGYDQSVIADEAMWDKIRAVDHFYDKLELMPGAAEMFDMIYARYGGRCEILTAIPKPKRQIASAREDKINWVRRLISEDIVVHIVYKEEKPQLCTGSDCILIDDYDENIAGWEGLGGTGILHKSPETTIEKLRQLGVLQ